MTDPQPAEKLQPGTVLTPDEAEFIGIYRKINPTRQQALIAALRATSENRYQAALDVLAPVYHAPELLAHSAAHLAALLHGAGWLLSEGEVR